MHAHTCVNNLSNRNDNQIFVNSKGRDQTAHLRSLVCAFAALLRLFSCKQGSARSTFGLRDLLTQELYWLAYIGYTYQIKSVTLTSGSYSIFLKKIRKKMI